MDRSSRLERFIAAPRRAVWTMALPMIGGMVSSTVLTLVVIPALYASIKSAALRSPRLSPSLQHP